MQNNKNITIGLLNFQYSNKNYGAVLQATALQHYLTDLGFIVETIDFNPTKKKIFLLKKFLKTIALTNSQNSYKETLVFENFRKNWLERTKTYTNLHQLKKNTNFDIYIVGSDQVWRPKFTKEDTPIYFLSFVPSIKKKIAYAVSFGAEEWEEYPNKKLTKNVKKWISQFQALSVRETNGIKICVQLVNKIPLHVLDPILLIGRNFFENIILESNIPKQKSKVVYYKLDPSEEFKKFLKKFGDKLESSAENIYYKKEIQEGKMTDTYIDVPLWLAKLRDAAVIITDSYHCICLAILFEKPFVYFPNEKRGMSRINSLLETLNINNVIYNPLIPINNYNLTPDFLEIEATLQKERIVSKNFLINSCHES